MRLGIALAIVLLHGAAYADETPPPSEPPPAPAPAAPKKSLRKPRPEVTEVEVVDLTGDRDPQFFALGAHIGGGYLNNVASGSGQGAAHSSVVFNFGLGPNGARVPWTLEPFLGFSIAYGVLAEKGGHPNRFTEIGTRLVYRGETGLLSQRWLAFGLGLVWTSRTASSGFRDPSRLCFSDPDAGSAAGLDCSHNTGINPALLVDLGVGLHEWTVRRARWGIALRTPLQISHTPGLAVLLSFYGQVGTAL